MNDYLTVREDFVLFWENTALVFWRGQVMTELWLPEFPIIRVVKVLGSLEAQCAEPEITGSFLLNQTLWLLFSHSLPEINHVLSDWSHCSQLRELV